MRTIGRPRRREEEEESVFVSMTDMTISFLFILMVLLAFFASRFRDEDSVPKFKLDETRAELLVADERVVELEALVASLRQSISALNVEVRRLTEALDRLRDIEAEAAALRDRIRELERDLAEARRPNPLETYLRAVAQSRQLILEDLRDAIRVEFPDLEVVISSESDALRFQGEGLFASGSRRLAPDKKAIIERIAELLDEVLPCYTLGRRSSYDAECNPEYAVIEAVQIEGHTDYNGGDLFNIELSSDRAGATYGAMTVRSPGMLEHRNIDGEPVLSVAGYGENRPVASNESASGRSTNRRIDLRFIMYSPSRSRQIEQIRDRLRETREVP